MRIQRYFVIVAFFLLLVGGAVVFLFTGNKNTLESARQTVETYCKVEFDGAWVEDRWAILKFSDERQEENRYREITDSAVFGLRPHYPFIVIASYAIHEVRVLSPVSATATVAYRRLAHSESATDRKWRLISEPAHDETVTLNLVFNEKKWWVFDPPVPRISKRFLLEYHEYEVERNSSRWEQELRDPAYNKEQKANVRASRDQATGALRVLKGLP